MPSFFSPLLSPFIQMNEEEINEKEQSIRKDRKFIAIKMKIDGYCKYNNKITNEMEQFLNVLDEKYNYYQYYLNLIHISIIFLSSMASFLLASQPYIHSSHAGVHLTSLCISTYTSLLLSVSKFMKLEEKKESLYRLRSAFAEFLIEICSRNDLLESWASHNYWKTREDTPTENMANYVLAEATAHFLPLMRNLKTISELSGTALCQGTPTGSQKRIQNETQKGTKMKTRSLKCRSKTR